MHQECIHSLYDREIALAAIHHTQAYTRTDISRATKANWRSYSELIRRRRREKETERERVAKSNVTIRGWTVEQGSVTDTTISSPALAGKECNRKCTGQFEDGVTEERTSPESGTPTQTDSPMFGEIVRSFLFTLVQTNPPTDLWIPTYWDYDIEPSRAR